MKSELDQFKIIHDILLNSWDPIGVAGIEGAEDKYDSYISDIVELFEKETSSQEIFNFLWLVETKHMKLSGDKSLTKNVANQLFKLGQIK